MTIPATQRDVIVEVLGKARGDGHRLSTWVLRKTVTTDKGETLYLRGVSRGTGLRGYTFQNFMVAVYTVDPSEGEFELSEGLSIGNEGVVPAAILISQAENPQLENKLRAELLDLNRGKKAVRSGISANFLPTV